MPTILHEQGFRFSFYSADGVEPAHVHVFKEDASAKWWLDPVSEAVNRGFNTADRRKIGRIVRANQEFLLRRWHEVFSQD